jgi:prepilin peptidase CpaA
VLATLITGFILNFSLGGLSGGLNSLSGCVFAFILMFILHVFGAMGAGDVKLFAAIGSVIGAQLVLPTFVVVVLTGGLLALVSVLRSGVFKRRCIAYCKFSLAYCRAGKCPNSAFLLIIV